MVLRKFFLIALFAAQYIIISNVSAEIDVPDFSFTGREITGFAVKPSYTVVNFNFKMPSKMDIYLQKQSSELSSADKKNYEADEPGFMYSGSVSTSLSSIFVGDKAYRNNIVKMFLHKSYIDVIESFEKYQGKLSKGDFYDEAALLYANSLFETGNRQLAFANLEPLAMKEGEIAEIAQDSLFSKLDMLGRYSDMEATVAKLDKLSPYSLSIWLQYLYSKDRYTDILAVFDKYPEFLDLQPEFMGMKVSSLYFLKRYKDIAAMPPLLTSNPAYPLVLDSLIMSGVFKKAEPLVSALPESDIKNLMAAKIMVAKGDFKKAAELVTKIANDTEKLSLFFYSVSEKFKSITPEFLSSFNFKEKQNNDYVNFYLGLKYLSEKKYQDAVNKFALVGFNKELMINSYFYQGIASSYLDPSRAEWNFMRYIGAGSDTEKLTLSKFMLSQVYFFDNKLDDALMLVDDCGADYCMRLKADIYLSKKDYNKSLTAAKGLDDDRARLIRATDYYNLLDYKSALLEITKIKKTSPDSEYILMMSLFKNKRLDDAVKIMRANIDDVRIFAAGLEQLILAGDGKRALAFMDMMKTLPPEYKIERAKLLLSFNKLDEAEKAFKEVIAGNSKIYESMQGLYQIAAVRKKVKEYLETSATFIEKSKPFDNKDLLTSQLADQALEIKEPNLAIRYVNYFFDNYRNSSYAPDVYKTRAKLYKFTARYENCVTDSDSVIKARGQDDDAVFLKAECMEYVDKDKAVSLYRAMTEEGGRFIQPASGKLTLLSDDPDEVLIAAERMKRISPDIYKSGMIRFLEISDNASFVKNKVSIDNLAGDAPSEVRAVALWRIGKDYLVRADYENAARQYLKGYYLFPKENYAVKNLEGAKASYDARKMNAESAKVNKLISSYDTGKKKKP